MKLQEFRQCTIGGAVAAAVRYSMADLIGDTLGNSRMFGIEMVWFKLFGECFKNTIDSIRRQVHETTRH